MNLRFTTRTNQPCPAKFSTSRFDIDKATQWRVGAPESLRVREDTSRYSCFRFQRRLNFDSIVRPTAVLGSAQVAPLIVVQMHLSDCQGLTIADLLLSHQAALSTFDNQSSCHPKRSIYEKVCP